MRGTAGELRRGHVVTLDGVRGRVLSTYRYDGPGFHLPLIGVTVQVPSGETYRDLFCSVDPFDLTFDRCYCGRPIRDARAAYCGEHD